MNNFELFTRACLDIAGDITPGYVIADNAPETFEGIKDAYQERGHLTVWSGASDRTIYTSPEGNYSFRAWHDWRHITQGADFSTGGECETYRAQLADLRAWHELQPWETPLIALEQILRAEVIGQLAYKITWGEFPSDQRAFINAFLTNEGDAIDVRI